MNKLYSEILDSLGKGQRTALKTYLPKGGKALEKTMVPSEVLASGADASAQQALQNGCPYFSEDMAGSTLIEPFYPRERIIILGGGHIALPLVEFAARVGFSAVVVDDRPSFANQNRFPLAGQVLCEGFDRCFDTLQLTEYDYVVVITRGHRHDTVCLRQLLSLNETVYLGMIGSRRRVADIKKMHVEEGFDSERIERICTPIGLPIGAVTPEEIAISIMAQVISRKRLDRTKNEFINRSEVDLPVVQTLARQNPQPCSVVTVVSTKGSTPRGAGAKMVVYPDGRIVGSIGGGCSEAAVIADAIDIIGTGRHQIQVIDLTGDVAESEGMVCGGIMTVLIEDSVYVH